LLFFFNYQASETYFAIGLLISNYNTTFTTVFGALPNTILEYSLIIIYRCTKAAC